jgi:hypothetical protein
MVRAVDVDELVSRMTIDEKLAQLGCVWVTALVRDDAFDREAARVHLAHGIGQTRKISMGPAPIVERLEERDEAAKKIVYSIVEGPLPVSSYVSTMQLTDAGEGRSKLTWSSTFEPVGDEATAKQIVSGIYDGGIKGLQARFGS